MDAKEKQEIQRKNYYQRNKEKMNRIARERYHKKRNDPEFYKLMLVRNQQSYYKKTRKAELTEEEEEEVISKPRKVKSPVKHAVKEIEDDDGESLMSEIKKFRSKMR